MDSLSGGKAFAAVFASGTRKSKGPVTVVAAPNGSDRCRMGLVTGRRVGGAVLRNRARRRIRHAMASIAEPAGFDLVVVAGPGAVWMPFQELEEALATAVAMSVRGAIK